MRNHAQSHLLHTALITLLALSAPCALLAQLDVVKESLPDAPRVTPSSVGYVGQIAQMTAGTTSQVPSAPADAQTSGHGPRLSLTEAEQMAVKNNPRISVSRLLVLAQHQVVRETRAARLPTATAAITAEEAEDGSRVSAGSLTASRLFEHAGAGGGFTQLIMDFGKTGNLIASSKLQEKAQNANALATTEDIVIATDQAFFNALQAQALLKVAEQNVTTRQTTETLV